MGHEALDSTKMTIRGVSGFENEVGPGLKELAKVVERVGRLKKVGQQADILNLMELRKQLEEIRRLSDDIQGLADTLVAKIDNFAVAPTGEQQAEWWERFRQAFHAGYPPVEGEYPVFQVFPVEIRVDLEHELVLINKRTVRALHPEAVATLVEKEWDRLNRERFNAATFAKALMRAYDLLLLEAKDKAGGRQTGASVPLGLLHQTLALRAGASIYGLNQFAFDIYRLRRSPNLIMDGRRMEFGSTRNRGIVITHPGGQQENLGALEVVYEDEPS